LDSFLTEAISAVPPSKWDEACKYESASVLTTYYYKKDKL